METVARQFGGLRRFARRVALSPGSLRPHYLVARSIGRLYYWAALLALRLWARSHRYIDAVLLTGSGGRGELRVGISDLDVLVVVKDGPLRDVFVDRCVVELALLTRLFPMISAGPHRVVFGHEEFHSFVLSRHPFLVSIPGFSRLLFLRADPGRFRLTYRKEHERCLASFLWQKVRIALDSGSEPPYRSYLCGRIADQFEALEERLGHSGSSGRPVEGRSPEALIEWHAELMKAVVGDETRQGAAEVDARESAREAREMEVPDRLFLETQPLNGLFAEQPIATTHRVYCPGGGLDRAAVAEALLRRHDEGRADFFLLSGFLYPLQSTEIDVLDPVRNPGTYRCVGSENQGADTGGAATVMRRSDAVDTAAACGPVAEMNRFLVDRLTAEPNGVFRIADANLGLAARLLTAWKCALDGEITDAQGAVMTVAESASAGRVEEARLQLARLLKRGTVEGAAVRCSVLIVTRDRCELLDLALRSLRSQTRAPDEVVVVDNGSTDDTAETVARHALSWPILRRVEEPRPGIALARNRALMESSEDSDVVAFIDDDCVADPEWLYQLLLPFRYDEEVVSAGGYVSFSTQDATPWGRFYSDQRETATQ